MENIQQEISKKSAKKKNGLNIIMAIFVIMLGIVGIFYWQTTKDQIYNEKAEVYAPTIALSSNNGGTLKGIFVNVGDIVSSDMVVAQVGDEMIKTSTRGLITQIKNNVGENFSPNETVVMMINPDDMNVIARVEEDKGLADIAIGQQVVFTVDAFGSEKFYGVVSEISPTSRESDVVFNISDKREVKEFEVKIKFDTVKYPQLKNGMSAKVWIFKK